jgi:decaprenylphospho-beta-D-erythro-pentofuranosid-2-ulose 2-reductase
MKKILILGATSAIAQATARIWAKRGDAFVLVARDEKKLEAVATDLQVRGAKSVDHTVLDLCHFQHHSALIDKAYQMLGGLDIVLIAHGVLSDQKACEKDFSEANKSLTANFLSVVSLLIPIANRFEKQGSGVIAVISSVAGDRGRGSNYVYGSAKAGVTAFISGLRNRLSRSGVTVLTIKPGFVDSPMTKHIARKGFLWATPETVANGIVKAVDRKRDVVYLPWFWRWIILIVRHLPERVFKKTGF